MSRITSHILDTSKGRAAAGIDVRLYYEDGNLWKEIAKSQSDTNGRITDLLNRNDLLPFGIYKMKFFTGAYFLELETPTLYPYIEVFFQVGTSDHYHIPLLISPFGYSTYRGT